MEDSKIYHSYIAFKIIYEDTLKGFIEYKKMRDKHFDHDENGMLQI